MSITRTLLRKQGAQDIKRVSLSDECACMRIAPPRYKGVSFLLPFLPSSPLKGAPRQHVRALGHTLTRSRLLADLLTLTEGRLTG
jgi:hypothetical protein